MQLDIRLESFAKIATICRRVAVKAEKYSRSMLHIEARVMRAAAHHNCRHICELLDYVCLYRKYRFEYEI